MGINIGVIGLGQRSSISHSAHKPSQGFSIVAGADPSVLAANKFAEKLGAEIELYRDYRQLLARKDIDAVFICSPDHLHESQSIEALQAGKHVYVEKPMAITTVSCDRILMSASKSDKILYIGHNMRHFPVIKKMKELIDTGVLGKVHAAWCRHFVAYGGDAYFKDWHSEQRYSNGLLLQKGVHDIDVLHWLCGAPAVRVVGMGQLSVYNQCEKRSADVAGDSSFNDEHWPPLTQRETNPQMDIEDHNMILMQMANGIQCSYMQCFYTPDSSRNYTFIGTKGRIENYGDTGDCQIHVYNKRTWDYAKPDEIIDLASIGTEESWHGGADQAIIQEFLECISGKCKPAISPLEARSAVATADMATQSVRNNNQPMDILPLSDEIANCYK